MVKALTEEPDRFAVLDVTEPEPPKEGSPLYTMENVMLSPHITGSFGNEFQRMAEYMIEEYERLISGGKTRYSVTKEMLKTMA